MNKRGERKKRETRLFLIGTLGSSTTVDSWYQELVPRMYGRGEVRGEQDTTDMGACISVAMVPSRDRCCWNGWRYLARVWILRTGRKEQTATSHLEINSCRWSRTDHPWTYPGPWSILCMRHIDFVTGAGHRRPALTSCFLAVGFILWRLRCI